VAIEDATILNLIPDADDGIATGILQIAAHEAAGVSKATVHRVVQDLLKAGQILRVKHGVYRRAAVN
jgi:DNA-binding MarR family transcriptional regulator